MSWCDFCYPGEKLSFFGWENKGTVWNFDLFSFQTHALSLNASDFKILTLQTLLAQS